MTANPSSEFEAWLATMGVPKDWVEDARNWLQRLFDQSGPVSAEDVKVAFVLDQMSAAEGAVELVLADLHRSSSERPVVVVDEYDEQIRISVDGSYQTPSVHAAPFDVAGMLQQLPTTYRNGSSATSDLYGRRVIVMATDCIQRSSAVAPCGGVGPVTTLSLQSGRSARLTVSAERPGCARTICAHDGRCVASDERAICARFGWSSMLLVRSPSAGRLGVIEIVIRRLTEKHTVVPVKTMSAEFDRALGMAAERSATASRTGRLDDDVLAALAHAGVSRTLLPIELGGVQAHPRFLIDAVARTAAADASTGWCLSISGGCKLFSGYIPEASAREIYADPDGGIAGMFAPVGVVTRLPRSHDGFDATLTGRWPFASNCLHSSWIGVGAVVSDDPDTELRRIVFLPADDLVIEDTWHSSGLQATGSHHVNANATPIQLARSCTFSDQAWADGPLWRMPMFTVIGSVLVAAPLGIARGAVDGLFDIVSRGTKAMRGQLVDDPIGLAELAAADAALRASYAGVVSAVDEVWVLAEDGKRAPRSVQARVLLAIHHAIDTCVDAVSVAHRLCGGGATYSGHPLLTALHDIHTARQHISFAHQHRARFCRIAAGFDETVPPYVI